MRAVFFTITSVVAIAAVVYAVGIGIHKIVEMIDE
jgi:hypothetical protein